MKNRERKYQDDDGRTIADMSWVEAPGGSLFPGKNKEPQGENRGGRFWENTSLSRAERWAAVRGAWKAALLIALAYIVGLGLVVLAICALAGRM